MQKKIVYSADQIDHVVSMLREVVEPGTIVTLSGLIGAGKTSFVQRLCASFGVKQQVVSPTYAYVSTYEVTGCTIHHFDLYRLSGIEEFESFGFSQYLSDPYGIVLIEWPDRISSLLARPMFSGKIVAMHFSYMPKSPNLREVLWQRGNSCVIDEANKISEQ